MKKIIIADSDLVHRELLAKSLELAGYQIIKLTSKETFFVEDDGTVDLYLIDFHFSENFIYEFIKNKSDDKPLFVLSNGQYLEQATKLVGNGCIDYFLKPYNIELIKNRIKYIFENLIDKNIDINDFHQKLVEAKIHNLKILIVDDNEMNRDMLNRRITKLGFVTDTAINGLDALEKLKKENYSLMLLDVMMPELDGFDVLAELKNLEKNKRMQIIMLTALHDKENVKKALSLGANDFIVKPFNFEQVKSRLFAGVSNFI
jgi:DNA-binding response OmpR family regulator